MPMLPENQEKLEYYVRTVKREMDELLDYMREGSALDYGAGQGKLHFLSDLMLYLADLLKSDESGRVAESFNEWLERKFGEAHPVHQKHPMFSK
jgi:hypothetical protein